MHPPVESHFYLKRSLVKLVGAEFFIYDQPESLRFLAHMKGFKLKAEITIYTDQAKTKPVMTITARQIVDFSAAYDITDVVTGQKIGVMKRKGLSSIIRDEWQVCGPNDEVIGSLMEDSMLLALVRRFLSGLVPQNYDLVVGNQRMVDLKQNFNPFSYHLNIDISKGFDPRMAIAAAVLLAAFEGRQSGY